MKKYIPLAMIWAIAAVLLIGSAWTPAQAFEPRDVPQATYEAGPWYHRPPPPRPRPRPRPPRRGYYRPYYRPGPPVVRCDQWGRCVYVYR